MGGKLWAKFQDSKDHLRAFARLVPPILLIPLEIEIMSTNNFHQQNTE